MDLKNFLSSFSANPKQVLKIVLLFSVVMLVIWLLMVSQMNTGRSIEINSPDEITQARADSIRAVLSSSDQARYADDNRSGNLFMNAFTTFLVLVSIMGVIWLWTRNKPQINTEKEFRELGSQVLGQNAQLKIMEINNEVWVMGITPNSVDLLHRYEKDEWTSSTESTATEEKSFYQILRGKQ